MKKLVMPLMLLFVALSLLVLPANSYALDAPECSIYRVGNDPRFEGAMVQLRDDTGTLGWGTFRMFYLSSALGNQGLATLLTAYSMNKTVWVRIAGDAPPGSLIEIIYIND